MLISISIFFLGACNYVAQDTRNEPRSQEIRVRENPIAGIHLPRLTTEEGVELLRPAHAYWARRDIGWSPAEPEPGVRNWGAYINWETEILNAKQANQEVIAIIGTTPVWALKEGFGCGVVAEEYLGDFGLFIEDLVKRYREPPYHIRFWELWNEPDVAGSLGCWGDPRDKDYYGGRFYADMLKVAYPAIKRADPNAQVLVGGLLLDCDPSDPPEEPPGSGNHKDCTPSRFLEGILMNGGGDNFDGVSFHAYDYYLGRLGQYGNPNWHSSWDGEGPVITKKASYIRNLLSEYGLTEKYLINTESAILCGVSGQEDYCQSDEFMLTKAAYIVQTFSEALALDLRANIWFSLKGWRSSGLVSPTLEPLPAYQAFRFVARELNNTFHAGPIELYEGVRGEGFRGTDVAIWLLWAIDGQSHQILLPVPPTSMFNVYGEPLPNDELIEIGPIPLFVFWDVSMSGDK